MEVLSDSPKAGNLQDWFTGKKFKIGQEVINTDGGDKNLYTCLIAHTSGVFATDLGAGKWKIVGDGSTLSAGDIKTLYESNGDTNAYTDSEKTTVGNQSGTNSGDEVPATETVAGIVERLTQAEANTGTDDTRYLTALKAKNTVGLEPFFLESKGNFGTGAGWADEGFISLVPNLLFNATQTERAIYMFFALARVKFDAVDPVVAFLISSTGAPSVSEAVRWQLTARYRADGEELGGVADEVLLQTQTLATLVADSRQTPLEFTLDRTLISDQDTIHLNLERLGGDGLDDYGSDIGVGQSGIIVQTVNHNP